MKKVVVAGDVALDVYEMSFPPEKRHKGKDADNWKTYTKIKNLTVHGGAFLLKDLIARIDGLNVLGPDPSEIDPLKDRDVIRSVAELGITKDGVIRVIREKGFIWPEKGKNIPRKVKDDTPDADIVVIDDPGNGFRNSAEEYWPVSLREAKPGEERLIVINKMSSPLAEGKLWEKLCEKTSSKSIKHIAVVSVKDLRSFGVKISRKLSWERTVLDLCWQMKSNPDLFMFRNCNALIVRFGVEGAVLMSNDCSDPDPLLYLDSRYLEDEFVKQLEGDIYGETGAFIGALCQQIALKGIAEGTKEGIMRGIISSQRLIKAGFGVNTNNPAYSGKEIYEIDEKSLAQIAEIKIPDYIVSDRKMHEEWFIVNDTVKAGLEKIAYDYVISGDDSNLNGTPVGVFNKLKTVDRFEIESFCSIKNVIHEYVERQKVSQPLCIGVFGSPGSGKSFGVTQVAESVAPKGIKVLEFNLSQFELTEDLLNAFHQVRDVVLSGDVPLVFFDEFDCSYGNDLGWLKYFLSPMQDGKFRDRGLLHPIGKAIFIFAGGTCDSYEEFSRIKYKPKDNEERGPENKGNNWNNEKENNNDEWDNFKKAKGPDFVSRLRGYVNIKGLNPEKDSKLYMIRRALILRQMIKGIAPHLFVDGKILKIDPGVLRAFIKVPEYQHGTRSMKAIIEMSQLGDLKSYEQSALPSPEQMMLHVNEKAFSILVDHNALFGAAREMLAKAIHNDYLVENQEQKGNKEYEDVMQEWSKLKDDIKESNLEQADHIPVKLKAINCDFNAVQNKEDIVTIEFAPKEIELMAEMEHDRWMSQKKREGWKPGPKRDDKRKINPCLVPWEELGKEEKDKDRKTVGKIPEFLKSAGFEVYRLR